MKTKLLYLDDAYLKESSAKIVSINTKSPQVEIVLDQTIFYPQGGGQPADTGTIQTDKGIFTVSHVSYNDGLILHKGKLEGLMNIDDKALLKINWETRYHNMMLHTAGHMLDQAVKNIDNKNFGVDGNHGIAKRAFVAFKFPVDESLIGKIEDEINSIVHKNLKITAENISEKEINKRKIKLQFELPKNKDLRILSIGSYNPMPDGGTHLKTTNECSKVSITGIQEKKGQWRVSYSIEDRENKIKKDKSDSSNKIISISELKSKVTNVQNLIKNDLIENLVKEELKTKYLGKKGIFNDLAKIISQVGSANKRQAGQILNELKTDITESIEKSVVTSGNSQKKWVDLTAPGIKPKTGHMHLVSQAMEEITQIFERIGFSRSRYPEVDWDWYVFESLNMPKNHPARDEWETFFVDAPMNKKMGKIVLTTHTSNGQVREMERLNSKPPIRMINIARCYRRQQDATHTQMFHQFEGLVIDKGINIQHLKGTLDYFAEQFYGPGTKSRIRPFHFQFTEPSLEVDFSCHICHGTGFLDEKTNKVNGEAREGALGHAPENQRQKCKFCKSGWHEVGGAGMVHPNVLTAGGFNPSLYTGFAFGWGVERTYTLKEGLNIDDIRLLYSGDLKFLEQF
ncbi:hypothetical protein KKD03_03725 [Patescibacteria group bacterium]|nr:hypothetical protein [Patescibacteria group bacterium]